MRRMFFQWLIASLERRRGAWLALCLVAFVASVALLATGALGMNSSRNGVVDADDPEQLRLMAYNHRFGTGYDIIALIQGADPKAVRAAADSVAEGLEADETIDQVFYRVDLEALSENGLYYLPTENLQGLLRNLTRIHEAVVRERSENRGKEDSIRGARIEGVISAFTTLNERVDEFVDGETGDFGSIRPTEDDVEQAAAFLVGLVDELSAWLADPKRTQLGLKARFARPERGLTLDDDGYLVADEGRLVLMRIRSMKDVSDDRFAAPIIAGIQKVMTERVPDGLTWGVTGVPVMVAEEQAGLKRDLPLTSAVSAVGCLLIFFIAYRSVRGTLVVFLPLAAGTAWALATAALLIGSLNLVTSAFAVILIGMGVDFSVHLFTRIRDERKDGTGPREATRRGLIGTGPAVLTGAVTSAAAFGAMALTDFRAVRELGIIAGSGLILVLIAAFVLMPLVLGREGTQVGAPRKDRLSGPRSFVWPSRANAPILVGGLLITLLLSSTITKIEFNFDWTEYLPTGSPAVKTMGILEEHGVAGVHFAITQAGSLEESRKQYDTLVAMSRDPDGIIDRVESIFDVLPPDLAVKEPVVAEVRRLAATLPRVHFEAAPEAPVAVFGEAVDGLIERLRDDMPFTLKELGQAGLADKLAPVAASLERLAVVIKPLKPAEIRYRLDRFEGRFASISQRVDDFFRKPHKPLVPADLPTSLVSAFYQPDVGSGPTYAVRIYPRDGVEKNPALGQDLADQLRELDPEATGYAITEVHFGKLMRDGLWQAVAWSAVIVLFLVLVDLRSPLNVFLALVPLMMGGLWMLGLMNVLGVSYGFANTVAIPLIIGIGIDSGIHVIHRWRECDGDVGHAILTTGKAILVSSLTTMCAFGSMMLASHGGVRDLGFTLLLGVGSCLVTSLIFLPALLDTVSRRRSARAG
ncbi:MAG: preprotein translocase subunit SecF [Myxococcota bacterium]|jgi:preprotein translocase subunit SecF